MIPSNSGLRSGGQLAPRPRLAIISKTPRGLISCPNAWEINMFSPRSARLNESGLQAVHRRQANGGLPRQSIPGRPRVASAWTLTLYNWQ